MHDLPVVAHIGTITTLSERRAAKTPLIVAALVLVVFFSKTVDGDLPPIVNVLDLEDRSGQAFTLTSSVLLRKGNAEVADARVIEVLAATNKADIPAGASRVILLKPTLIALNGGFAVGAVLGFHLD